MGAVRRHQRTTTFSPAQERKMVPSGFRLESSIDARLPGPTPCGTQVHAELPAPLPKHARGDMTAVENGRKISAAQWRLTPMRVVLAAHAGLFADAFSGS